MFTMVDEMLDRAYQQGRAELNAGIARSLAQLASTVSDELQGASPVRMERAVETPAQQRLASSTDLPKRSAG